MDVAQLVRASDCGSEGRGFETHLPPPFLQRPVCDMIRGALCVVAVRYGLVRSNGVGEYADANIYWCSANGAYWSKWLAKYVIIN